MTVILRSSHTEANESLAHDAVGIGERSVGEGRGNWSSVPAERLRIQNRGRGVGRRLRCQQLFCLEALACLRHNILTHIGQLFRGLQQPRKVGGRRVATVG
jgi:hypothetical protein